MTAPDRALTAPRRSDQTDSLTAPPRPTLREGADAVTGSPSTNTYSSATAQARSIDRRRPLMRHLLDELRFPRPSRYPTDAFRVRWVRRSWTQPYGVPSWNVRWYVNRRSADRFARKLADDGAVVQVDAFHLEHLTTSHIHQENRP